MDNCGILLEMVLLLGLPLSLLVRLSDIRLTKQFYLYWQSPWRGARDRSMTLLTSPARDWPMTSWTVRPSFGGDRPNIDQQDIQLEPHDIEDWFGIKVKSWLFADFWYRCQVVIGELLWCILVFRSFALFWIYRFSTGASVEMKIDCDYAKLWMRKIDNKVQ